ncbi:MAG: efflux RND transporter permease subunit [Gammaproteobacteria bacterium]|nr:efflux RND transporter permease subunit [Gammaproteobacteria bacterium]MBU1647599.1 efflux RND transporter permease subunit [Gammaproteobacteria bacterium]MBU1971488.1 efflux RND transporter permease subunit [Gammaproteobacteria bacterium]
MNFYRRLIENHPFANITFAVVLAMGLLAYLSMPREQDPEINFNWVSIFAFMPGAAPEDVERLVTKPLEDAIKNVPDVRFSMSSSRENVASILVRFREVDGRTFDKRVNDLRREIQNKSSELPVEAKDPKIWEITTSNGFPTAMLLLEGQADDETLRNAGRQIKDEMERLAGIDRVYTLGLADPELRVDFDPHAAQARGLAATDIADGVAVWFRDTFAGKQKVMPSGTQAGGSSATAASWLVRVQGQEADPDYLARIAVSPAADPRRQVSLEAVAQSSRARATPSSLVVKDDRPGVMLSVTKKSYINTLELVERINDFIARQNVTLAQQGLQLRLLDDQTVPTRKAINLMESNALMGLLLVIAVCWLFLGTRIAVLIGLGIPFSLAGTFGVLHALGYTLNISVLLGVVIALGMLVDDAVVVVETIYYRMQRGADAVSAAVDAMREVFAPVTSSVLTTLAAFLPLMLLPGIVGKFMFIIPFVVALALAISLIEAYWMLPTHVAAMNIDYAKPSRMQRFRNRFNHTLRVRYGQALVWVLRRKRLSYAALAVIFTGAILVVAGGLVKVQFFAFDPLRLFYVNVDAPAGVPIEETLRQVRQVEERVRKHLQPGDTRAVASYAGAKFTDTEPLYGDAYGQVVVTLTPDGRDVEDIVAAMRQDVEATPISSKVSFTMLSGGPPTSKAIKARVRGDDPAELRAAADELKAIVQQTPATRDVTDDDVPGRPQFTLRLDREAIKAAGLNPAQVARVVRLHVDGEVVAVLRDRGEKIDVRVRAKADGYTDIADLLHLPIALPDGRATTLGALARAETRIGAGVIKHYNLRRAITIEADLDKEKTDTLAANAHIKAEWDKVRTRFPATDIDFSGEMDDIQESLDAMKILFLLGVGLIFLILAAQFRSYFQPLLILSTVPLAFTGVVYGLLLSRHPLSLYTLYGVIALTGIAVNSAIVLIDAANDRRRRGMSVLHAILYASRRRVVPILITSLTTVAGLASLAFGLAGKSLIWGPVASGIVWGLTFSTALTLFVVPLLYRAFMEKSK